MIVSILINTSVKKLNKVYDYKVKDEDLEKIEIGKRVKVNFGKSKNKYEEGIIVKIHDENYLPKFDLKYIDSILDEKSYIDETKLKLAKWMAYMYFCNVYDVLKLMLPPGSNNVDANKDLKAKEESYIMLSKDAQKIEEDIKENKIKSGKQILVLKYLIDNGSILLKDILSGLNITKSVVDSLAKKEYIYFEKRDVEDEIYTKKEDMQKEKKTLTLQQKNAVDEICKCVDEGKFEKILLFGVTGSGKTEVYIECIEKVLKENKTVIVLVPEISLTSQTVNRFTERFGNIVSCIHSKMTLSKRKEEYRKIVNGDIKIIIGARSAIFAPIKNLGMIIIDEEHDSSYYSQMNPKYSTKEVAAFIAKEKNATLVLGSATPEVSTYYKAVSGSIKLLKMTKRPNDIPMPEAVIIDKKKEALRGKENTYISEKLKNEILINKKNNEQTIIFLNRRGYSSYLMCSDCKSVFKCPNCDVTLTYHKRSDMLTCHYCGFAKLNPNKCYNCSSQNIYDGTFGTEKIEEVIKNIDPTLSVIRMDKDTTISKDSHKKILDRFKTEKIDVLIGTQMVSKGHDIPNVTLVGILGSDNMLNMNDYLATERAYSNISQVAGRAGRASKKGRTIIETSDPQNLILNYACHHDYEAFYASEINFRKMFNYPPFVDLLLFTLSNENKDTLKKEADRLYKMLSNSDGLYNVFTPHVPYMEKINNKFRINILIKTNMSKKVIDKIYQNIGMFEKIGRVRSNLSITRNPVNV